MNGYLEQIQRGVDYIEARLDVDIALASVAKAAGLSQWHFQRIFHALTGETLKAYIRSRRLAHSLDRLLTTKLRVLDIAILAGFESQEAFARAFKKAFGITPQEYRKLGDASRFLKKPQFDLEYLRHINGGVSPVPEIYEQPPLTLVGLRTQFFGTDSEKNNLAEKLPPLWQSFLPRLREIRDRLPGVTYGVVRQEREDSDRLEYHAAAPVADASRLPNGMVVVQLPAATYAKFAHRGPVKNVDHTVNYVYANWLAQSGRRHTSGPDLEMYGSEYHPDSPDSVIHYAIPVTTQ